MRVDQGVRFESLDELEILVEFEIKAEHKEPIEMDRIQYAAYKELVWRWLQELNPISVFKEHPIVVIKREES